LYKRNLLNQDDYFEKLRWTKKLTIERDDGEDLKSTLQYTVSDEEKDNGEAVVENQYTYDNLMDSRCKFEPQELVGLLSYLPNLLELDLKDCKNYNLYDLFTRFGLH
jgi:hypothetical protein